MYLEDTDLGRRMHAQYRTVYYPEAKIVHEHARGSYKVGVCCGYICLARFDILISGGGFSTKKDHGLTAKPFLKILSHHVICKD